MGKEYLPSSHLVAAQSSLPWVSPITAENSRNFQEFAPISPPTLSNLAAIFSSGDSDPSAFIGPGAEQALKLERGLALIAQSLGVRSDDLFLFSDKYLGFYSGLLGLISTENFSTLNYSEIEKKDLLAIIAGPQLSQLQRNGLPASLSGQVSFPDSGENPELLTILQIRNGETGIWQSTWPTGPLFLDATSAPPLTLTGKMGRSPINSAEPLPAGWLSALFDSSSWGGPRGVYLLAINQRAHWKNPLPTFDPQLPRFGANYGLTLWAAAALESFKSWDFDAINQANLEIREIILNEVSEVESAGVETFDRISISFLHVPADELLRRLYGDGFLLDSGSACSPSALEPSHVLTAMGILSHGNVRIRIRPENCGQAKNLAHSLVKHVKDIREEIF